MPIQDFSASGQPEMRPFEIIVSGLGILAVISLAAAGERDREMRAGSREPALPKPRVWVRSLSRPRLPAVRLREVIPLWAQTPGTHAPYHGGSFGFGKATAVLRDAMVCRRTPARAVAHTQNGTLTIHFHGLQGWLAPVLSSIRRGSEWAIPGRFGGWTATRKPKAQRR